MQLFRAESHADRLRRLLKERAEKRRLEKETEGIAKQKEYSGIKLAGPGSELEAETERKRQHDQHITETVNSVNTEKERIQNIVLNAEQKLAVSLATEGKEFCLIGAAGTGKTTTSIEVIKAICKQYAINIEAEDGKAKKVAIVAFTRRAARNSAKNLEVIGAGKFCMTAHRFLEYHPEKFEYFDEDGCVRTSMQFVPGRDAVNPIHDCKIVIVEESSMLGTKLYDELKAAAPNAIFIFIGDLNQLPPVFGDAILGFKLAELPVVELTQVYRQALESPIVHFQHNYTLRGTMPSDTELKRYTDKASIDEGLEFIPFKQTLPYPELYGAAVANYMIRQMDAGNYDPDQDTILVPFNKKFGSIAINEELAETLGRRRGAIVWEILAGFSKKYFAVDDFVMYEKSECTITDIEENPNYFGSAVNPPSPNMTRTGLEIGEDGKVRSIKLDMSLDAIQAANNLEKLLDKSEEGDGEDSKTREASAIITVQDHETGAIHRLRTAGDISGLDFGYCMTIHKSQGSEWRKVWLIMHKLHATMLSRELIYTGMTRAKKKLTMLYTPQTATGRKDSSVAKAIKKARIPGKTWKAKVEYFKGKTRD